MQYPFVVYPQYSGSIVGAFFLPIRSEPARLALNPWSVPWVEAFEIGALALEPLLL